MTDEYSKPMEHKAFNKVTIRVSFALFVLALITGGLSFFQPVIGGTMSYILGAACIGTAPLALVWTLYRLIFAKPYCPKCKSASTSYQSHYQCPNEMIKNKNLKSKKVQVGETTTWRKHFCEDCPTSFLTSSIRNSD